MFPLYTKQNVTPLLFLIHELDIQLKENKHPYKKIPQKRSLPAAGAIFGESYVLNKHISSIILISYKETFFKFPLAWLPFLQILLYHNLTN